MEILLRHIVESDFSQIKKYVTSNKVTKYLTWDIYKEGKDILLYMNSIKNKKSFPDESLWIICNWLLIGTIHIIARDKTNIQFWFWIIEEYWWKGIWTKVVKKSLDYIRNKWWLWLTILWDIHKKNKIGKKVLEKNNFICTNTYVSDDRERYIFLT